MQSLTCKGSSLLFLSILSSVCPGCSNACQTACQFYLKPLTSWGADLLGQPLSSYQVFAIDIVSAYINLVTFFAITLLARATVPFPSLFILSLLHFLWVELASFQSILMLLVFCVPSPLLSQKNI